MKILVYTKATICNKSCLKKVTHVEYDPANYHGGWVFTDLEEDTSCVISNNNFSLFANHVLEYILYYQNNGTGKQIWSFICRPEGVNNLVLLIYLDFDILEHKIKNDKLEKKHHHLLYLLAYTIKLENMYLADEFNEDWKKVHIPKLENSIGVNYNQPNSLKMNLYGYQLRTLNWMIRIENDNSGFKYSLTVPFYDLIKKNIGEVSNELKNRLKYIKMDMLDKHVYYKNDKYHKMFVSGGILADEMGLGKTITTISLMLTNPLSGKGYKIKMENNKFKTKANLVICPSHLAKQWQNEIEKACPIMKIILCLTKPMHEKLTYQDIINADVVIISFQFICNHKYYLRQNTDQYTTLSRISQDYYKKRRENDLNEVLKDINKISLDEQLATKKVQFEFFEWHRLIIDEGHEIFGNMSGYGNTMNYVLGKWIMDIKSTHRWYITGTPFINDKGFDNALKYINWLSKIDFGPDAKKLVNYMDICQKGIYKNYFRNNILKKIYYRNTKESVGDEYNVPPIVEEAILLEFTEFERSMYTNYQTQNYGEIYLRQLCCHPQISDKDRDAFETEGLSLEEVRQSLIKHNKKELKEASNKLAEIKLDKEQFDYKGKIKRCENKINQFKYMIDFFDKIDPIVPNLEDDTCSICLCEFEDLVITECGHFYCKECIQCSLNTSNKYCPMCREKLSMKQIHPVIKKEVNKEIIDKLTAKYGTKMGRLISICRKLFNNPKNRIIIFSQWDRMLNIITSTLKENDINTVSCKGHVHQRNCAIQAFKKGKKDKDIVRVIMLSLENAASGINLTEATHIILIDPIAGSKEEADAIEGQAIGRACRLGQNKQVRIIRLIIKDTIEHELYKRNMSETAKIYSGSDEIEFNYDSSNKETKSAITNLIDEL